MKIVHSVIGILWKKGGSSIAWEDIVVDLLWKDEGGYSFNSV